MDDGMATDMDTFFRMVREFPIRTSLLTFSLPVFALLQVVNGILHGSSMPLIGSFAVLAIVCSVLLAQYQLAVYRTRRLSHGWH